MKKVYLFMFFFSSLLAISVFSENDKIYTEGVSFEEYAKTITNRMIIELNLSSEQIENVDSINLRFVKAEQILLDTIGKDGKLFENAIRALDQQKVHALSLVLNKKQMKDYKKILMKKE